jgi:predicted  nucleic acid-binding Zn-ribbon protein
MGITIKQILGVVAYGFACFIASLVCVQCSERSAQRKIQEETMRAESAEATVSILQGENERLRNTIVRANDAVERALNLILEAQDRHDERMDIIENDPESADWLQCNIPSGVREAFADYYRDSNTESP